MLVSTFELLLKPIIPIPGSRRIIQGYFLLMLEYFL